MEVRKKYPKLKVVYARSDEKSGELALSSHKLNSETIDKLTKDVVKVENEEFTLSKLEGDALKDFWQNQGGHYQFCIQPKLRNIKKQQKAKKQEKAKEKNKRAKVSYEIAGTFYADINKVKSKARAILNLKKDGEKLTGNDEEFIKELIKFHEKHDEKMKDF